MQYFNEKIKYFCDQQFESVLQKFRDSFLNLPYRFIIVCNGNLELFDKNSIENFYNILKITFEKFVRKIDIENNFIFMNFIWIYVNSHLVIGEASDRDIFLNNLKVVPCTVILILKEIKNGELNEQKDEL